MTDKILKKQEELQSIRDSKARLMRRLIRTVNAIAKLDARERRLLKPRKLEPNESNAITGHDHHKIMDPEFFDDSEVLATF